MSKTPPVKKSSTIFPYRGKWRIQYFDSDGKIRTKTVETREAAYKELVLMEQLVAAGKMPRRAKDIPTFQEWIPVWLESRRSEVRPVTFLGFQTTIKLHLLPALGHLKVDQITPLRIETLYRELQARKELTANSIHRIHALLNHSLASAARHGFTSENPCHAVRKPKATKPKLETLTSDEIARLLQTAAQEDPLTYLRWLLAIRFGLRQGEALALTWGDFDLNQKALSITKTVNNLPGIGNLVTPPKSEHSNRTLPLDQETAQLLAALLKAGSPKAKTDLLFQSSTGSFLDAKTDYDRWQALLKKAGIPPRKLHAARHAAATQLLNTGANIRAIQLILGHSSPTFTMATYLHPDQEVLRGALENASCGRSQPRELDS